MVTDRTQADVDYAKSHIGGTTNLKGAYNHIDLNRVESKVAELEALLSSYNYFDQTLIVKLDWTYTDKFKPTDAQRYLSNIKKIRDAFYVLPTTPALPSTMQNLDYQKANDIEQILVDIESLINNMRNWFVYSGVSNSGQSRVWQNRFRRYADMFNTTWNDLTETYWSDFEENETWEGAIINESNS